MKRRVVFSFVFAALIIIPLFSVCQGAESSKVIELRFSCHIPPFAPPVKMYQKWADQIAADTDGQVKITIYAGSTLLQAPDVLTGVKSGIADMALFVNEMFANTRPLTPILSLPFMGLGNWEEGINIMNQLRDEFPALNDEWKDFKLLFRELRTGLGIHATMPVRVPNDLKGQKIISTGMMADIVNGIGGSAISLSVPDWYTSLDRGLAKGMFMDLGAIYETKVYALMPYHTDFPHGMAFNIGQILMNPDKWKKLPPQAQKAIDKASAPMEAMNARATVELNKQYRANMEKEGGHTFIMLNDDEARLWFEAASPEHQKYLSKAEARGLPAKAIYDRTLELARKAGK